MSRVYIVNLGEGNLLWPVAQANHTIITTDNVEVHDYWLAGDRDGYIAAALEKTVTARRVRPTRPTAGRWYNLLQELHDTEGDLWITKQGNALWWTTSVPGELKYSLHSSTVPDKDGPDVWRVEKPCQPWSDRDRQGRPLRWDAIHPKARDFLITEATFQTIANDRGYADYTRALIDGVSLERWHAGPLFSKKAEAARKPGAKIYTPKEVSVADMTRTMLATVAASNGQTELRRVKEKLTELGEDECGKLLLAMLGEQEDRCALTGLPFAYPQESDELQLRPSLDRIDSNGHYTPDNVQIVCRFINRWKRDDNDPLVRRLLDVLKVHWLLAATECP